MSPDVLPLPTTDNQRPASNLSDRRRRAPRDAGGPTPSTNPDGHQAHDEAQARSAAEPTAPEVRPSDTPADATAAEQNGEGDAAARPRAAPRISKARSKTNGSGNGHDHGAEPAKAQATVSVLTRLALLGAAMCIALSVVVLGISMPHLASGVSRITACELYTAIFMAVVFDLSQVAAEFAVLVMPLLGIASRRHHLVCAIIIAACTLVSMTLNVRAFLEHVTTPWEAALAIAWGGLLPILVLLLVFVASSFIMRLHGKPPAPAAPAAV